MIMKERALQSPIHVPFVFGANYKPMHYKCLRRRDCFCTRIPLSTPPARLVTPDLAVDMIERDHSAGRERARDPIEGWSAAACEAGVPGFDVRSMPNRLQALTVAVSRIDGAGMQKSEKNRWGPEGDARRICPRRQLDCWRLAPSAQTIAH